jgi:hypothetical protein
MGNRRFAIPPRLSLLATKRLVNFSSIEH